MVVGKKRFIREYVNAIREGNAAVFAGAGLSRSSGFVDWKGLLRNLASEINLDIDRETDLLSVAQFYRNEYGTRSNINKIILDAFSGRGEENENIKILSRLPIFTYWTTNYDQLLESGLRLANRNPDVKIDKDQLSVMKRDRDAIVYKMHGDVEHPAKAVLTKEDYDSYESNRPLFRTALKGDLISKVFLFIGFSFSDPNIDYIISQVRSSLGENTPTHYCFFRRVQESDFKDQKSGHFDKAEYGYCLAKQDLQEKNLRQYGIQTVFVDSYDEITQILRDIERISKLKNIFISGSLCESDKSRNEADKLASALAGKLVHEDYRIISGFGLGIGSSVINGALDVIYKEKYHHLDEHLSIYPFPQNILDPEERKKKWAEYREKIMEKVGVAIFMFGNKKEPDSGEIKLADGCIAEFQIAKRNGSVIIPIGSTGYAAKHIYDEVKEQIDNYPYLKDVIEELGNEKDANKLVSIILKVINNAEDNPKYGA